MSLGSLLIVDQAIIGPVLLGLCAACVVLAVITSMSLLTTRKLKAHLSRLDQQLKMANSTTQGMGQQVLAMEKIFHKVMQDQKTQKPRASEKPDAVAIEEPIATPENDTLLEDNKSNLEKAKKLLTQGRSIDEIAKDCHLSFAEVSLLQALARANHPESLKF